MSYDKLIDSAQLDSAMSATADAIREKTGDTAKITWDASKGFASAISAISAGSKVATGSFTVDSLTGEMKAIASNPVTVGGLDFKPTAVIIYLRLNDPNSGEQNYAGDNIPALFYADSGNGFYTVAISEEAYDEDTEEYYTESYITTPRDFSSLRFTYNDDGFTVSASTSSDENGMYWYTRIPYYYVAIG